MLWAKNDDNVDDDDDMDIHDDTEDHHIGTWTKIMTLKTTMRTYTMTMKITSSVHGQK